MIQRVFKRLSASGFYLIAIILSATQLVSGQSLPLEDQKVGGTIESSQTGDPSAEKSPLLGRINEGHQIESSPLQGQVSRSKHFDCLQIQFGELDIQTEREFFPFEIWNNLPAPEFVRIGASIMSSTTTIIGKQLAPHGYIDFPQISSLESYRQHVTNEADFARLKRGLIPFIYSPYWPVWRSDKPIKTDRGGLRARLWATGDGHVAFFPNMTSNPTAELVGAVVKSMTNSPEGLSLPRSCLASGYVVMVGGQDDHVICLPGQPGKLPVAQKLRRVVWAKSFFMDANLQATTRPSIERVRKTIQTALLKNICQGTIGNQILQAISPGVQERVSTDLTHRFVAPDVVYLEVVVWPDGTVLVAAPNLSFAIPDGGGQDGSASIMSDFALSTFTDGGATFSGSDGVYFYGLIYIPRKLLRRS